MKTYHVVLTGKSPLLMHWDNIEGADALRAWRETPEHKKPVPPPPTTCA